jgi:hypothetical protein
MESLPQLSHSFVAKRVGNNEDLVSDEVQRERTSVSGFTMTATGAWET